MKSLQVKKIFSGIPYPPLGEVSDVLEKRGSAGDIAEVNWKDFPVKPDVRFFIGYGEKEIFIRFKVRENAVKAEKTSSEENVYEDSCVEFFISPVNDRLYYNFEFNPIGTLLMASGTGRKDRSPAPAEVISSVRRITSLGTEPFKERLGEEEWEITAAIPFTAFYMHEIKTVAGRNMRANFYKCGDKLSTPHYLSWNKISTERPDFHCPDYFGTLSFE